MAEANQGAVQQGGLSIHELPISGVLSYTKRMKVATLADRRTAPPSEPQEWLFQTDLEDLLYPSVMDNGTNSAFYRLLGRSDAGNGMALPLRRSSVAAGLVTEAEFNALKARLHPQVRAFTLVPIPVVSMALATYGSSPASEALVAALELPRPAVWPALTRDDEGEGEEEEEGEGEDGDEGEDGGEGEGGGGSGSGGPSRDDQSGGHGDQSEHGEEEECPTTEEEAEPEVIGDSEEDAGIAAEGGTATGKRKAKCKAIEVPPPLAAELASFERFRTSEINVNRKGKKVMPITAHAEQERILAFFKYLRDERGIDAKSLRVFVNPKIGPTVQAYIKFKTMSVAYSTVANDVAAFLAAARCVHAAIKARADPDDVVSTAPIDDLAGLLAQCKSQGRLQASFHVSKKPKGWLDWSDCNKGRAAAERALESGKDLDAATKFKLTRDVCLMRLLTGVPPDRVGVYRLLKLGSTLKATEDGGYQVELNEAGQHKTSAVFGATCTTLPTSVAAAIDALVSIDELVRGDCLFHSDIDRAQPLTPWAYSRFVKSAFKAHAGVAMCPKDARASFVTWARSGEHGDDVLTSAARQMHHSSSMQESATYDKEKSERVVSAASKATEAFSEQFY